MAGQRFQNAPPTAVHPFAQVALVNLAALASRLAPQKYAGADVALRTHLSFSHEVNGEPVTVQLEALEDRAGGAQFSLRLPQGGGKLIEALPEIAALIPYYCGPGRPHNIEHRAGHLTFQVLPQ